MFDLKREKTINELMEIPGVEIEFDENGQMLVYTGVYRWADETLHNEPEEAAVSTWVRKLDDADIIISRK